MRAGAGPVSPGALEVVASALSGLPVSRAAGPSLRPGGQRCARLRYSASSKLVMTLSLRPSLQTSGKPAVSVLGVPWSPRL